jgi:hypothetical protein
MKLSTKFNNKLGINLITPIQNQLYQLIHHPSTIGYISSHYFLTFETQIGNVERNVRFFIIKK